jgi:hypothetical protein
MKELYQNVMEAITLKAAQIKWVDFNMGQYNTNPPPVNWPCCLIDLSVGDEYTPVSAIESMGTVIIEVSVGFRLHERTNNAVLPAFRNEALEHIDTVEQVRAAVERTSGQTFTPLTYSGFEREQRSDYRIWTLRFATQHTVCTNKANGNSTDPYQPWPGPGTGPNFCVHPNID